eukprot:TRINITY_DN63834_c0_g3_i1.p1 TRINITY_DN63834_c0_g3~~TRINITY_DN63834_c0_g3_i1.p1  ORF type:complete len:535 (+),score=50.22 TRINITY_DN63834_c0_g3_i1:230-1606(+)
MGNHSILWNRMYAGGPVCSPTRATVLTGRNHNRDCIWTAACNHLPHNVFTIAQAANLAGYRSLHVGKFHLGSFSPSYHWGPSRRTHKEDTIWTNPGTVGFDEYYSTMPTMETSATFNCGCFKPYKNCITGHYNVSHFKCDNYWYSNRSAEYGMSPEPKKLQGDDAHHQVEVLSKFVKQQVTNDQPFLAVIWFHNVHHYFVAADKYRDMYPGVTSSQKDYYGCLTAMDGAIGKVQTLLKESGIYNNTMVWFNSDNGPEDPAEGPWGGWAWPGSTNGLRGRKREVYEGGIRVPGIVQWPERIHKNRREMNYPVCTVDYLPTVMDLLNVRSTNPDWAIDGISLLDVIDGKEIRRPKPLAWQYRLNYVIPYSRWGWRDVAYTDNEWKFIAYLNSSEPRNISVFRLYNIVDDPFERHDLAKVYPKRVKEMSEAAIAWRDSVKQSYNKESMCNTYPTNACLPPV